MTGLATLCPHNADHFCCPFISQPLLDGWFGRLHSTLSQLPNLACCSHSCQCHSVLYNQFAGEFISKTS
ncbi:hypothetical protein ASPWEDRAFT_628159 [Aspergillus wentii DTO 134E9]|uniref:Uncharacterized protein n=1 Tax=Aspergillus wentii DTO 134E9 TaxID=1073089 RepID=A0A1L9R774_ASPWE|nr:uncharacterized protein ASPWEDRAFT_670703 [Aspergillus wentii DTO 134E9]XP_040685410.1 uncharacterized protein ASPWEDRAFT_628159 [Aspergillus wentii DTO 134E9]OJJ30748.1 hypothetical protein ASPWEDRAFT_670703 [Aspergillus wentii DTO 134E9]OJJ31733.1 hypothetical protein ASPWEDRAFT_628159 [Aspergillus wentii DTO 134E9]